MSFADQSQAERVAMEIDRQVCLARHHYKRMNTHKFKEYLKTIPKPIAAHIRGKMGWNE